MPPSAGWGAVRHRAQQKIGAKLNQSILEMALVSRCQGERLRERDQAGAGRRGPGRRHQRCGTAWGPCRPHSTPQCHSVDAGILSVQCGAEREGVPHARCVPSLLQSLSSLHPCNTPRRAMPWFPRSHRQQGFCTREQSRDKDAPMPSSTLCPRMLGTTRSPRGWEDYAAQGDKGNTA